MGMFCDWVYILTSQSETVISALITPVEAMLANW